MCVCTPGIDPKILYTLSKHSILNSTPDLCCIIAKEITMSFRQAIHAIEKKIKLVDINRHLHT